MKRFGGGGGEMESISMAGVLMLLSRGNAVDGAGRHLVQEQPGRVFECKTCSRRFPSFQALGGHRASHKKPKLGDGHGHSQAQAAAGAGKPRTHECSICGLEFPVGQALGGHMRRHRGAVVDEALFGHGPAAPAPEKKKQLLDLNLPPLTEDDVELKSIGLSLEIVERKVPMVVDCFH